MIELICQFISRVFSANAERSRLLSTISEGNILITSRTNDFITICSFKLLTGDVFCSKIDQRGTDYSDTGKIALAFLPGYATEGHRMPSTIAWALSSSY
jgi:hypothetical protein